MVVDLLVGSAVTWLAAQHLLAWDSGRWASRVTLPLGLLLAAAPALLRYSSDPVIGSAATADDVATGLVVVAGAALALAGSGRR